MVALMRVLSGLNYSIYLLNSPRMSRMCVTAVACSIKIGVEIRQIANVATVSIPKKGTENEHRHSSVLVPQFSSPDVRRFGFRTSAARLKLDHHAVDQG